MAGTTTTTTLSSAYLTNYLSKDLLAKLLPALVLAPFGTKHKLPKNAGAKSMTMFRFSAPSTADVQTLAEGTPMSSSAYKQLALESVTVALAQYGQVIEITDILDATSLFHVLEQANTQNAQDAALHCDTVIRNKLADSGAGSYTTNKTVVYAGTPTSWSASITAITATEVLDSVTALKLNNSPRIGGYYVAAAPPQVTRDLMKDGSDGSRTWLDLHKYAGKMEPFNGEVGRIYGARFVETTNPFQADTGAGERTYNASGNAFSTFIMGADAFGVPDLEGSAAGGSGMAPQVYLVRGPQKSDPLNQKAALAGWKTYWAAAILQPKSLVQIWSKTGYGV